MATLFDLFGKQKNDRKMVFGLHVWLMQTEHALSLPQTQFIGCHQENDIRRCTILLSIGAEMYRFPRRRRIELVSLFCSLNIKSTVDYNRRPEWFRRSTEVKTYTSQSSISRSAIMHFILIECMSISKPVDFENNTWIDSVCLAFHVTFIMKTVVRFRTGYFRLIIQEKPFIERNSMERIHTCEIYITLYLSRAHTHNVNVWFSWNSMLDVMFENKMMVFFHKIYYLWYGIKPY